MSNETVLALAYRTFDSDPYLALKPLFAYSYATQLVLNGVILSLLVVLLAHLLFTFQYHYPLARLNCILQISGVGVTLLAVVATLVVILQYGAKQTDQWPYMNDFMYVRVPKDQWNVAEQVAWYTMEAVSSGIVQITHIQFLTLLYPSELEARLIFGLLGPIALASSAMTFTSLGSGSTAQWGMIVRNICNSALSLLFTTALFLWGFVVNRNRAWRTDGGTAAFGAGALVLAVSSTAVNFLEVKVDKLSWLQHLLWSIILWQSWLGWWWWVGSGMGIGEVEDMMEKEYKRARKAERRRVKKEQKLSQRTDRQSSGSATGSSVVAGGAGGSASAAWSGLISSSLSMKRRKFPRVNTATSSTSSSGGGAFEMQNFRMTTDEDGVDPLDRGEEEDGQQQPEAGPSNYQERSTRHRSHTIPDHERERDITLPLPNTTPRRSAGPNTTTAANSNPRTSRSQNLHDANSSSSLSSSSLSGSTPTTLHFPNSVGSFALFPFTLFNHYVSRLGRAHDEAAKRKARERTGMDTSLGHDLDGGSRPRVGWGLGEYGNDGGYKIGQPISLFFFPFSSRF
ncbi:hypothetical protein BDY24DRAFT_434804 [Mrakia frigida]|uniref:uncharacterized protein n=1 Tax=Mrakia frigida TaxID=29902 RepID=UPI003FCBFB55